MESPSSQAVEKALSNLLKSTEEGNDVVLTCHNRLGTGDLGHVSEVIQLARTTLHQEGFERSRELNKTLNEAIPIQSLPPELLCEIFRWALESTIDRAYHFLHNLAQVSISWARLIVASPILWGEIDFGHPQWRQSLRRSGATPLRVIIPGAIRVASFKDFLDRFEPIRAERHRWLTFTMTSEISRPIGGMIPALAVEGDEPLPLLEEMTLKASSGFPPEDLITIPPAPRLRVLRTEHAAFRMHDLQHVPTRLTRLEVVSIRLATEKGLDDLVAAIAASPLLEDLLVDGVRTAYTFAPRENVDPIYMPGLSRLRLRYSGPVALELLRRVRCCPGTTAPQEFCLEEKAVGTSMWETLQSLFYDETSYIRRTIGDSPLSLTTNARLVLLSTFRDPPRSTLKFKLQVTTIGTAGNRLSIFEILNYASASRLKADVTLESSDHGEFLFKMPSLEKLSLLCLKFNMRSWIEMMGRPEVAYDTHVVWRLPQLSDLRLSTDLVEPMVSELQRMVISRHTAAAQGENVVTLSVWDRSTGRKLDVARGRFVDE